jgi:hypothetical protein
VLFGILPPEVIPLSIAIRCVRVGNEKDLLHNDVIVECGRTQFSPIPTLASIDHIVDRRECVFLMVQMAVQH